MRRNLFLFSILLTSTMAYAETPQEKFCGESRAIAQEQEIVETSNRLAFKNDGGLFNGGVCWWHSRLQRSATYLAVFRPELPRPTSSGAVRKLLRKLKYLTGVAEIPGYESFADFSQDWHSTIQKFLNAWQVEDGILYAAWIRGLEGSHQPDPDKLQRTMMALKEQVVDQKKISYVKIKYDTNTIEAHAWLIYSMDAVPNGYKLGVIDSNFLTPIEYVYHWGDPLIQSEHYSDPFMIYLEQTEDFDQIENAIHSYCGNSRIAAQ